MESRSIHSASHLGALHTDKRPDYDHWRLTVKHKHYIPGANHITRPPYYSAFALSMCRYSEASGDPHFAGHKAYECERFDPSRASNAMHRIGMRSLWVSHGLTSSYLITRPCMLSLRWLYDNNKRTDYARIAQCVYKKCTMTCTVIISILELSSTYGQSRDTPVKSERKSTHMESSCRICSWMSDYRAAALRTKNRGSPTTSELSLSLD